MIRNQNKGNRLHLQISAETVKLLLLGLCDYAHYDQALHEQR